MRKKNKIVQEIINEVSDFLIKEFLEYYPFNSYQFLMESLSELKLSSANFDYSVNMLEKSTDTNEKSIENTLWIATIRQRLIIKLHQLSIDRKEFKSIVLKIDSSSNTKEKSITCKVIFIDSLNISYQGKPVRKKNIRTRNSLKLSSWVIKMKQYLHS